MTASGADWKMLDAYKASIDIFILYSEMVYPGKGDKSDELFVVMPADTSTDYQEHINNIKFITYTVDDKGLEKLLLVSIGHQIVIH